MGFSIITHNRSGIGTGYRVNRLVAQAFIKGFDISDKEQHVWHIDGDTGNNALKNLEVRFPAEHWKIHRLRRKQKRKKVALKKAA